MTERSTVADVLIEAVALVNALNDECRVQYEARVSAALARWKADHGSAIERQVQHIERMIRERHPAPAVLDHVEQFREKWTQALADPNVVTSLPARRNHPETAHEAAWLARPTAATHRGLLLVHFAQHPDGLTAWEAWRLLREQRPLSRQHNVNTRIAELAESGWVLRATDVHGNVITRPTDTGAHAEVHVFNPVARDEYEAWRRDVEREAG